MKFCYIENIIIYFKILKIGLVVYLILNKYIMKNEKIRKRKKNVFICKVIVHYLTSFTNTPRKTLQQSR